MVFDSESYLKLISNPELIRTIEWRQFEVLIADMLKTFGYEIELMRGTKDGGIDIIAYNENEFGHHKYLIQAKRWSDKVGVEVVKEVLGNHVHYKVSKSCIVTTSLFTKGARDFAEEYKWQLELIDYNRVQSWIQKAWETKNGQCDR